MSATFVKNPEIVKAQERENKRMHKATGCEGKVCFESWSAATRQARRGRMKGRGAGVILAPYRCKFCGSCYHLTTVDPLLAKEQKRNRRQKERQDYDDEY